MAAVTAAVVGGAAIAATGAIVGGKMAADAQKDAASQARTYQEKAMAGFYNVDLPKIEELKYQITQIENQGELTPEMEQLLSQKRTELETISVDAQYKMAQIDALNALAEKAENQGMTLEDRSKLEQIMSETRRAEKGQREAILQKYAEQGLSGSGMELAAQLAGNQGAAERNYMGGLAVGAEGQKQALEAIMQRGKLAGEVRSQEFGEQEKIKSAQDSINRLNTELAAGIQQRNVGARNQAQERNLNEQQRQHELNVALKNQKAMHDANLKQQMFENEMNIARGAAGQLNEMASTAQAAGQGQAAAWSGMGQGIGQIGTSIATFGLGQIGGDKTPKKT